VAAHPEDSNGATRKVTIGTTEDRSRDRCLTVRPKKLTQGDGGYRQKLAAARRHLARCAYPPRRKGSRHKGPTAEKRTEGPQCNNGISNRGLKEQPRLGSKRAFNKTVRQTPGLEIAK
jgi:hypothetical protein